MTITGDRATVASGQSDLDTAARAYARLGLLREQGLPFPSDWNGRHPYVADYLGPLGRTTPLQLGDPSHYSSAQADADLIRAVRRFHAEADGQPLGEAKVVVGSGATQLLATVAAWLHVTGVRSVFYQPPMHYTTAGLFRQFGITPYRLGTRHLHEAGAELALPAERAVLFLADPIWYAGRRVPARFVDRIRDWQLATGSLVVVDGTFGYLGWDSPAERCAGLVADRTVRLVCPTKSLSMHGFRFAYLLAPRSLVPALLAILDTNHGTTSLWDREFGRRAVAVLRTPERNLGLLADARERFARITAEGLVADAVPPETGYFAFVRPAR
ncbi:MAG TPA: aminotransferase class I/II-fold pyridoxal phosphate-dependent enzyme, partial [Mycobacteriales bacterium]|nr:aminotransferase class I/II-fold pyridoxal phosphate-dependent enzyme [Mycobacteriales bacterium]